MSNLAHFADQLEKILLARIASDTLVQPTLPRVVERVFALLRRGQLDTTEATRILEQDPLLAARTLRRANTTSLSGANGFKSLYSAVERLGGRTLREIMVEVTGRNIVLPRDSGLVSAVDAIWSHSVAVALMSRDISAICGYEHPEHAYMAGLLHDLGKPVVAIVMLELETGMAASRWVSLDRNAWTQVIDRIHRNVGIAIAEKWDLADPIERCIRDVGDYDSNNRLSVANFVVAANAVAKKVGLAAGAIDSDEVNALLMIGKSILGLDEEMIGRFAAGLHERSRAA